MTGTFGLTDAGARFGDMLERAGRFFGRIGFGFFLLVALGATLVATTFIGILLAVAAAFLTLGQRFGRRRTARTGEPREAREAPHGPPPTLEAHRTADGWVTEKARPSAD